MFVLTFAQAMDAARGEEALREAGFAAHSMAAPEGAAAGRGLCLGLAQPRVGEGLALLAARDIPVQRLYWQEGGVLHPLRLPAPPLFSRALGIGVGDAVAVVGCGGKTSLMNRLARENSAERVVMTTTTHIRRPEGSLYDREAEAGPLLPGVTLLHGGEASPGKLRGVAATAIAPLGGPDTLALIEADGSRGLPLKGWAAYEPVVPDFATATVGVCTVSQVGLPLTEENTHRLPLYCALTGQTPGRAVTVAALAAMITQPDGMFRGARGRRILYINQVEGPGTRALAETLAEMVWDQVERVVCGSLRREECEVLCHEE